MRWSRLKKLLEDIIDPKLDLKIHCTAHRGEGGLQIGRYWIVLNGETIFDEPRNISGQIRDNIANDTASIITSLLRRYLDTPRDSLLTESFAEDGWDIIDIIRAADRRIGKRRVEEIYRSTGNSAVKKVIEARFPEITCLLL